MIDDGDCGAIGGMKIGGGSNDICRTKTKIDSNILTFVFIMDRCCATCFDLT
jgi:hypothetical protein